MAAAAGGSRILQSMAAPRISIGIDLGTTNSCAAVFKDGKVNIIPTRQGKNTTPSVVAFNQTEHIVGEVAKTRAAKNPENTVFDAKRVIGLNYSNEEVQADLKALNGLVKVEAGEDDKPLFCVQYQGEEKKMRAEQISALVLKQLKEDAEAYLGTPVLSAVITVPAYFSDAQREATIVAGKIAGLEVLRIVNEPTAASIAYGLEKAESGERNVLIFDMGGGTFDVSLVSIDSGVFEVKATGGDVHLGGEDFDNLVVDFCWKDFKDKHPQVADMTAKQIEVARRRLRPFAEKAKHELSAALTTAVEVDAIVTEPEVLDLEVSLTRAQLEELCNAKFEDALKTVQKVMADSGLAKGAVQDVVLVGGSTRIPKVQQLLEAFFDGKELCRNVNPDEVVAQGAAYLAAMLDGRLDETQTLLLVDVAPMSLGLECAGGKMAKLIERNSVLPIAKKQKFTTFKDNQESVLVKVFEGEQALVKENNLLGEFKLTGIPRAPKGTPQIEVTYEVDVNGTMSVSAKHGSTQESIKINAKKASISKDEIARMAKEFDQPNAKEGEPPQKMARSS